MRFFFMIDKYLITRMGRQQRDAVVEMVLADEALLAELFELVSSGTQVQRMKGAWVMSGIQVNHSKLLQSYHSRILKCLLRESVGGVKRELLRCFERTKLASDDGEQLIVIAMSWVTDEKQDIAVRYLCYRLLLPLLRDIPELQVELSERIEFFKLKVG
jgi:hypothetical protein